MESQIWWLQIHTVTSVSGSGDSTSTSNHAIGVIIFWNGPILWNLEKIVLFLNMYFETHTLCSCKKLVRFYAHIIRKYPTQEYPAELLKAVDSLWLCCTVLGIALPLVYLVPTHQVPAASPSGCVNQNASINFQKPPQGFGNVGFESQWKSPGIQHHWEPILWSSDRCWRVEGEGHVHVPFKKEVNFVCEKTHTLCCVRESEVT